MSCANFTLTQCHVLSPVEITISNDCGQLVVLDEAEATDVSFLPAMSRRRLSRLSKIALSLAHQCAPGFQGPCVFGSQHGELQTTQKLLQQIVSDDLLSPAGFSASVHNTAAGLHSIQSKNHSSYNSIAAGSDTLMMCMFEAWAQLDSGQADEVLLVYADDKIPAMYEQFLQQDNVAQGFAALVSRASDDTYYSVSSIDKAETTTGQGQLVDFVKGLGSAESGAGFTLSGKSFDWRWDLHV